MMWMQTSPRRFNDLLIEPPVGIQEAESRGRVRLLAVTALIVTTLYALLAVIFIASQDSRAVWLLISSLLSAAIYGLSRTMRYDLAFRMLPLWTFISALGIIALDPGPEILAMLVVPVLVAGFLWSPKASIALCALEIAAVVVFGPMTERYDAEWLTIIFLAAFTLIEVMAIRLNNHTKQELQQRTHELAESESRFRAIVTDGPDSYYLLRSVCDEAAQIIDFEIVDANPLGLRNTGLSREQLIGSRVNTQLQSFLIENAFEHCKTAAETGQPFTDELMISTPHGTQPRWYTVIGVPVSGGLAIITRDITTRKAAEEAVRESEARFRNIADSAPVFMWVAEANKQINYFNRAWLTFTGRTLDKEAGYGWAEAVHPDDREACVRTYNDSFDARQSYQMFYRLQRHDGEYRWLLENGVPRYTDDHVFLGYMGSAVDITDQKTTENALRASRAHLEAVIQSLPFEVWAQDRNYCCVLQNAHSIQLWGNVIGQSNLDAQLPEMVRREWNANNRRAMAGEVVRKEVVYDTDSGPRYTYNIVVPVKDGDDILGIAGVNIDVTELKQMEAKIHALLEAIPDFMARISRDGTYLEVVHGTDFQDVATRDQPVGKTVYDILLPESAELRMMYVRRALDTGTLQAYEYPFQTETGETRQFEARVTVSGPDEALVILRDVTARREAEARTLDLTLERERMALLQRFVGDRTHDLMTPLTILKTSLYLLTKADSEQRRADHIAKLNTQVDHLEAMIRNMLMILRLDKPIEDEFEFAVQDLDGLIEQLVAAHQPIAISRQQILEYVGLPSLPLVRFDSEKLKQALANLIDNALKYTDAGGTVRVTARLTGNEICIAVSDSGRGIPSEDLPHIFDRFFRSASSPPQVNGSGLGLAIVDKIVRAHGGRVEAQSSETSGSVFQVFLPLKPELNRTALPED